MAWSTRTTRTLLIAVALVAAATTAIFLLRHQQRTLIGCPLTNPNRGSDARTDLQLIFKEFRPAGNQFAGSITVNISPRISQPSPDAIQKWTSARKQVSVRLDHYTDNALTYQGGTDEPIALAFPPAWGALRGKGTFTWNVDSHIQTDSGPFYYPFDRYTLHINPMLMEVSDPAVYPILPLDQIETDFGNSNFIPHLHNLHTKSTGNSQADPYDITLDRPILLRTLALIVAALFVLWLIYLIWSAKPSELSGQAGQVVTLFVGVFSIRGSLLSGAPLFPSLIDYCALAVYLAATLIVLIRWMLPGKTTQDCPFCASPIPLAAIVCPQCTRKLTHAAGKSS